MWHAAALLFALVVTGGGVSVYQGLASERACADVPTTSQSASRCWDLRPFVFSVECRFPEGQGYTAWMDCPADGALDHGDKFRFKVLPGADGYLYAWEVDERRRALVDLLFDASKRRVSAGEPVLLPRAGLSLELDRQTERTRFVAILSGIPVDLFERSQDAKLYTSAASGLVLAIGESLTLQRRGTL